MSYFKRYHLSNSDENVLKLVFEVNMVGKFSFSSPDRILSSHSASITCETHALGLGKIASRRVKIVIVKTVCKTRAS